jgi:hypothetical protein
MPFDQEKNDTNYDKDNDLVNDKGLDHIEDLEEAFVKAIVVMLDIVVVEGTKGKSWSTIGCLSVNNILLLKCKCFLKLWDKNRNFYYCHTIY